MSEAMRLADELDEQAEHHFQVAQECDMRPCDTLNWEHFETNKQAAAELHRLAAVEQELEALKRAISEAEPDAWMHVCRKKPELRNVYFTKYEPALAAKGYEPHPLYTLKGIK